MAMTPSVRTGLIAATTAYGLWGFLPLYFKLLGDYPPLMVLAHRIVWSVPTALIAIMFARKLPEMWAAVKQPKVALMLLLSAVMIAVNWTVYIWAVMNGRVLEGSLGYFMNPLVSFLFAAMFFGERFRPLQLAGLALAALGVANQAIVVGQFPWVSLALAVSFAVYGAIRKQVAVDSRVGFGLEAAWLAPLALLYLAFLHPPEARPFGDGSIGFIGLLIAAGPLTATPLILFALGARKLKLSTIAMLQYIAPSVQFFLGLALGEAFTPAHAVTFGLIWLGVGLFTVSALHADRRVAAAPAPGPAPAPAPAAD